MPAPAPVATKAPKPMMDVENIARTALLMATLPPDVNMLEAIVIPNQQLYIGAGVNHTNTERIISAPLDAPQIPCYVKVTTITFPCHRKTV